MLVRIVQFLLGASLAAGGGYLAWTHRVAAVNVFPPGADGMPWLAIAGLLSLAAGVTFLVSAVHPRPNRRARLIAEAEVREAKLGAAESYYSERSRAADRDWRSSDIPEPVMPAPAPAPEPVRVVAPAPEPVRVVAPPPAPPPPAPPPPVVAKPVATSAPPLAAAPVQTPFPATATLAPIPAASEPPPPLTKPAPVPAAAPAPVPAPAPVATPAAVVAAVPAAAPAPAIGGPFEAIRAAIAAGQLDAAEKMLNVAREKAEGLALAELTGLAGDHAAAAGRISNAKWLWRLAAKRFGELGAMDTPAAKAVSESLRTAG